MKKLLSVLALFSTFAYGQVSNTLNTAIKPFNGYIFEAVVDTPGNKVFIGGSFKAYDPFFSSMVKANGTNLIENRAVAMVKNGAVNVIIPDGSGGVYIGGSFDNVGGQPRIGVAQINSAGNVTAFTCNIDPGSQVYDLMLHAGNLYVGGTFNTINGSPRSNMAQVNAITGVETAVVYNTDGGVSRILTDGTSIFVGGAFGTINSIPRFNFAQITVGGTVLPLAPNPNGQVDDMELSASGTQLFLVGNFNFLMSNSRNYAASIDLIGQTLTNWNPNPDWNAYSIEKYNNEMVIAGSFTMIGGLAKAELAILDTISGNAMAGFNPPMINNANSIYKVRTFGSDIFVCGSFSAVNGQPRSGMFVCDASGVLQNITCFNGSDYTKDVFYDGASTYVGGPFADYGGVPAKGLIALDLTTFNPVGTIPGPNNTIYRMRIFGDTLFGVGEFNMFGDSIRNGGFAYKFSNNTILDWQPGADDKVFDFQVRGNEVLVVGMFDTLQGQQRFHIGKTDRANGTLLPFNCPVSGDIYDVALRGNEMYITGAFGVVNSVPRNYFAAVDYTNGTVLPLDANADLPIYESVLRDSLLYLSGTFTNIFGQLRDRIACVNINSGTITNFNPGANNYVESMCLAGEGLYIGGAFSNAGGMNVNRLAVIDVNTGTAMPWVINCSDLVHAIRPIPNNKILVLGEFLNIDGNPSENVALFDCTVANGTANVSPTACLNGTTVLNATSGNSTAYQWFVNPGSGLVPVYDNPNYLGATSQSLNVYSIPQSFSSNSYRIRYGNNCSYNLSPALSFTVLSPTLTAVSNDTVLTCPTDFATLHGNGPSGATYTWSGPSGFNSANQTVQVNQAGSYSVTVTVSGCSASDAISVINNPTASLDVTISVTPATCGTNNGVLSAAVSGGTGNYSYLWTNGDVGTFADSLKIGRTYYVEVKDLTTGCKGSANAPIPSTGGATITPGTVQGVTCAGLNDGSISTTLSGGTPPFSINWIGWSYNTASISNLQAGIYEMLVTDAAGCVSTYTANVNGPSALTYTLNTTPTPCGINNGIASLNLSGGTPPYSVSWLPSGTGTSIANLAAGSYTFTIQDNNGCMVQDLAAVSSNSPVFTSIINSTPAVCGNTNGMIQVNAINGTGPYLYAWNNGSTGATLNNVSAGSYVVGVTDLGTSCVTYHLFDVEKTTENYSPEICTITVDTSNNTNILVWENGGVDGVKEYKIWRATNDPEVYQYLTTMPSGSGNLEYHDVFIDASMKPYGYKITAIDSCNEETGFSIAEHRPLCLYVDLNGAQTQARLVWTEYLGNFYNQIYIWKYNPGTNWVLLDSVLASAPAVYFDNNPQVGDIYLLEASLMNDCDPARGVINTTRSNIKTTSKTSTGISSVNSEFGLVVFPNPSTGIYTLQSDGRTGEYDVEVLNALGQTVLKRNQLNGTSTIDLNSAENGIYYLKVVKTNKTSIYKLILKR